MVELDSSYSTYKYVPPLGYTLLSTELTLLSNWELCRESVVSGLKSNVQSIKSVLDSL